MELSFSEASGFPESGLVGKLATLSEEAVETVHLYSYSPLTLFLALA